jgi:hypothetical protein
VAIDSGVYNPTPVGDLPDLATFDYVDRVNRAIDHVMGHLDGTLTLEEVARAACFSPFTSTGSSAR